jgi:hypothetical protein
VGLGLVARATGERVVQHLLQVGVPDEDFFEWAPFESRRVGPEHLGERGICERDTSLLVDLEETAPHGLQETGTPALPREDRLAGRVRLQPLGDERDDGRNEVAAERFRGTPPLADEHDEAGLR